MKKTIATLILALTLSTVFAQSDSTTITGPSVSPSTLDVYASGGTEDSYLGVVINNIEIDPPSPPPVVNPYIPPPPKKLTHILSSESPIFGSGSFQIFWEQNDYQPNPRDPIELDDKRRGHNPDHKSVLKSAGTIKLYVCRWEPGVNDFYWHEAKRVLYGDYLWDGGTKCRMENPTWPRLGKDFNWVDFAHDFAGPYAQYTHPPQIILKEFQFMPLVGYHNDPPPTIPFEFRHSVWFSNDWNDYVLNGKFIGNLPLIWKKGVLYILDGDRLPIMQIPMQIFSI